jgi:hypothetical protein
MTVKDLDALMIFFYNNHSDFLELLLDKIHDSFDKENRFTDREMLILLYKLVDDGYVTKKNLLQTNSQAGKIISEKNIPCFYMSFNGILLMDSLPKDYKDRPYEYLQEASRRQKKTEISMSIPKKYWWVYDPLKIIISLLIGFFMSHLILQEDKEVKTKTQADQSTPKTLDSLDKRR